MSEVLSISFPEPLMERLNRMAHATQRPVEELVIAALNQSVPCPPAALPDELRNELTSLETLPDEELVEIVRSTMSPDELPETWQPGDQSDRLALRKAYAAVLLKWRGSPLDEPEEFTG